MSVIPSRGLQVVRVTLKNPDAGDITYDPSALHLAPEDRVKWVSADGPFAIQFFGRSPFLYEGSPLPSTVIQSLRDRVGGGDYETPAVTVGAAVPHGRYSYGVSIFAHGYVYTDNCGSGIIEDWRKQYVK